MGDDERDDTDTTDHKDLHCPEKPLRVAKPRLGALPAAGSGMVLGERRTGMLGDERDVSSGTRGWRP